MPTDELLVSGLRPASPNQEFSVFLSSTGRLNHNLLYLMKMYLPYERRLRVLSVLVFLFALIGLPLILQYFGIAFSPPLYGIIAALSLMLLFLMFLTFTKDKEIRADIEESKAAMTKAREFPDFYKFRLAGYLALVAAAIIFIAAYKILGIKSALLFATFLSPVFTYKMMLYRSKYLQKYSETSQLGKKLEYVTRTNIKMFMKWFGIAVVFSAVTLIILGLLALHQLQLIRSHFPPH